MAQDPALNAKGQNMKYTQNCVYAVSTPEGVKVGFTSRLGDRLSAYQKKYGVLCRPIFVSGLMNRSLAIQAERTAHQYLADYHISGEFFSCPESVAVACIKGACANEHA